MHNAHSIFPSDRYSAKKMLKPVNFICVAPGAKHVNLVGDFNGWDPAASPMNRQPDGGRGWRVVKPVLGLLLCALLLPLLGEEVLQQRAALRFTDALSDFAAMV